ncbi:polysaccharide deacetylase family protein [Sporomusa sp.]|uniref:polysaccharide deacetylase family protein n=1 Tax=Sporomusa sp. TaxID=2078658 RepID=UPI002BBEA6E3|nr:polysaccharide deacetylase family protein [Sporomusa sp.]HWR08284.1 polysaccharide deacetylase family protein [Sporomusa sp.]
MINKKIVAALVLLGLCLLGGFFLKDFAATQTGGRYRNITDAASPYQADAEITQALEQLKKSPEKATVITRSNSNQRQIALTFDGLTDRTTMQQILDLLKKYQVKATFFVDGMQTAEDPQTVVNIKTAGQRIGNYTLAGLGKMENLPAEQLVRDFSQSQTIIKIATGQGTELLKCNDTKYTDQLLQAAKASGFKSVVSSDIFLNVKQVNSLAAAEAFVGKLRPGSIVSIKLQDNVESIISEPGKTALSPAVDKQPGLKALPEQADLSGKALIDTLEKLLIALNKGNYITTYVEEFKPINTTLQHNNNGDDTASLLAKITALIREQVVNLFSIRTAYAAATVADQAQEIKTIFTTEPALAYTFGGLANEAVVTDVLGRLKELGIIATFFVAEPEMKKYPGTLRQIIANGHEIGIAIRPKDGETADETRSTIMRDRKNLQEQFGVETNLVKQPWGAITDATKEAVLSQGCRLIGQSVNVVQSKHKDYTSADQVMAEIFGKSVFSVARGQIIHFRLDYYTNDRLVGDLVATIKQRKVDNIAYATSYDNPENNPANDSQYMIKPVGEILSHTQLIYQYPVDPTTVPARLRADRSGLDINQDNILNEVAKRYIGNKDVAYGKSTLGFSKMETRRLDTSGLVHTEDNVIFLTFDDWGTDAAINKILYVLRKHNATATFFILTNNVLHNPNLLRTIAMEGHNIGNHSDQHRPMAFRDPKTVSQVTMRDKEEYSKELALAYKKLHDVTGDMTVNGKPALTRFFRPPTLAISKAGVEAVLESGSEYIVSGSCSTNDYKAESVPKLVNIIKDGIYTKNGEVKKGSVLVMHMIDSAAYTAMALDILLTANEAKADSDPSKFKVGRLSDYLTDDYSQINRKQSLKLTAYEGQKLQNP